MQWVGGRLGSRDYGNLAVEVDARAEFRALFKRVDTFDPFFIQIFSDQLRAADTSDVTSYFDFTAPPNGVFMRDLDKKILFLQVI